MNVSSAGWPWQRRWLTVRWLSLLSVLVLLGLVTADARPVLAAPGPSLSWPVTGVITARFGEVGPTSPRGHAGLDIAAPLGTPVKAARSGRVVVAGPTGGPYGIMVVIDHGDGMVTRYAHLSAVTVEAGQKVKRDRVIGAIGSTGFSTGPHLHFEVRQNGRLSDPLQYLIHDE